MCVCGGGGGGGKGGGSFLYTSFCIVVSCAMQILGYKRDPTLKSAKTGVAG